MQEGSLRSIMSPNTGWVVEMNGNSGKQKKPRITKKGISRRVLGLSDSVFVIFNLCRVHETGPQIKKKGIIGRRIKKQFCKHLSKEYRLTGCGIKDKMGLNMRWEESFQNESQREVKASRNGQVCGPQLQSMVAKPETRISVGVFSIIETTHTGPQDTLGLLSRILTLEVQQVIKLTAEAPHHGKE